MIGWLKRREKAIKKCFRIISDMSFDLIIQYKCANKWFEIVWCGSVAVRTLNRENPGSNSLAAIHSAV